MLFNKLYNEKGITKIDMIVIHGSYALFDPLKEYYPDAVKQRYVLHVARELKHYMAKIQKKRLIPMIMSIFRCDSKQEAWAR